MLSDHRNSIPRHNLDRLNTSTGLQSRPKKTRNSRLPATQRPRGPYCALSRTGLYPLATRLYSTAIHGGHLPLLGAVVPCILNSRISARTKSSSSICLIAGVAFGVGNCCASFFFYFLFFLNLITRMQLCKRAMTSLPEPRQVSRRPKLIWTSTIYIKYTITRPPPPPPSFRPPSPPREQKKFVEIPSPPRIFPALPRKITY